MRGLALAVVLGALSGGCAGSRGLPVDTTLPDGEILEVQPAQEALEAFAADPDPGTRGRALAAIVRHATGDERTRWLMQGTYDPDPWVQRAVVTTLLDTLDAPDSRAALQEYVLRGSADPYVRAQAAHRLLDAGLSEGLEDLRTAWQGREGWRAAPLALVALRMGEEAAFLPLSLALSQADVRDDASFIVALGRYGPNTLVAPLTQGANWAEEELATRLAFARGLLGDPSGEALWQARLASDDGFVRRDAFDLVLAMPTDARSGLAASARRAIGRTDAPLATLAALVAKPTAGTLKSALRAEDPYVLLGTLRLLQEQPPLRDPLWVATLLLDEVPAVRVAAAETAGVMGAVALRGALEALAVDDRSTVRVAAYAALLRLPAGAAAP